MLMDVFEGARRRTAGAAWIPAAGRHDPPASLGPPKGTVNSAMDVPWIVNM